MAEPIKQAIYTLTPGRSGTVYLAELLKQNLPDALVYHERTGFPHFGVNTPDASHATTFNHVGNVNLVKEFWRNKLARDAMENPRWFVEISHHLAKAGLIENLDALTGHRNTKLIFLRRDPFKVAWSYINRFEFINNGYTWLFSLDPAYPRRIVDSTEYCKQGVFGRSIWYVNEVYARQAYYQKLLATAESVSVYPVHLENIVEPAGAANFITNLTGIKFEPQTINLPSPQNAAPQIFFDDNVKQNVKALLDNLWQDPESAGADYFNAGHRLGEPQA